MFISLLLPTKTIVRLASNKTRCIRIMQFTDVSVFFASGGSANCKLAKNVKLCFYNVIIIFIIKAKLCDIQKSMMTRSDGEKVAP